MNGVSLTLTEEQHKAIFQHLFPQDGKEAAVIALCRTAFSNQPCRLLVQEVIPVPYEICDRSDVLLIWSTSWLDPLLVRAEKENLALVKIHSHPNGFPHFSSTDDRSDKELFVSIHSYLENNKPQASCVMLPDGQMFGRLVDDEGNFTPLCSISVIGENISFWPGQNDSLNPAPAIGRQTKAFGRQMVSELRQMSAVIIGCSGTGSIVAEQIARLGFGRIVLIDPDIVKLKNMDRILNAYGVHVRQHTAKAQALKEAIDKMELGTKVEVFVGNIADRSAIRLAASCDVAFGCVDGAEGRAILDRLCFSQLIPVFDVGVSLTVDGQDIIDQVDAEVRYVHPRGPSLLSRNVYTTKQVADEILQRTNPQAFEMQKKAKYVTGRDENEQPAVIPVNMAAGSFSVLELLARLYKFRHNPNNDFSTVKLNIAEMDIEPIATSEPCPVMSKLFATGDKEPLLGMPLLGRAQE